MKRMFKNVVYCYLHCFSFSGRDARPVFCDYYIFLTVFSLVVFAGVFFLLPLYKEQIENASYVGSV